MISTYIEIRLLHSEKEINTNLEQIYFRSFRYRQLRQVILRSNRIFHELSL
jgi:hypothetical protein